MKRIYLSLILVLFLLFFMPINLSYADANSYHSMAVCCEDNLLYSKNENMKLPMASTTKIFTALTVIENCKDLNEKVNVPKQATLTEGTSIYLKENEKLTVKELLYGLMLRSGNDAAVTLACHISGSTKEFANLMNVTAQKYGLKNTSLKNPHGLLDYQYR